MRQRTQRGFTLVELMIVVAIIAVMSVLLVSVATQPGNPEYASVDITSSFRLARQRAMQTRRIHRVQLEPNVVSIWQSTTTGFQSPGGFEQIQATTMPPGIIVFNASTTVQVATGATPTLNATLLFPIDFRPDGSSTGGTAFVTDLNQKRKFRALAYPTTGGAYLREDW